MDAAIADDLQAAFADWGQSAIYQSLAGGTTPITALVCQVDQTEPMEALSRDWFLDEADILVLASEVASPECDGFVTIGANAWRIRSTRLDQSGTYWTMRCTHDERKIF